ncbi:MAG TPA: NUDIX domain-containing protein [Pyrinomonadaceae bacterium]|nr:NUDIX domain-containing protein [Pyrinomonadaceae bacterium]
MANFQNLISRIWRKLPARMRRWTMRLAHARFTVTAGAVIFNDKGEVLLLKHRFRAGSGWGLPGGFMETSEQPVDALRRELREEIGLEVDDVKVYAARSFKKPKQVEVLFLAHANRDVKSQTMEVERAEWFAIDALPEGLPRDQRSYIERAAKTE